MWRVVELQGGIAAGSRLDVIDRITDLLAGEVFVAPSTLQNPPSLLHSIR
jgi:hypothetical protein